MQKKFRVQNKETLAMFRGKRCLVCGKPSDPCHIQSRGAGGDDEEWNLISLCRFHHTAQHSLGWSTICRSFPIVRIELQRKGWMFDERNRLVRA